MSMIETGFLIIISIGRKRIEKILNLDTRIGLVWTTGIVDGHGGRERLRVKGRERKEREWKEKIGINERRRGDEEEREGGRDNYLDR
jgi:hypothetical protein